jgi:peptidoglycan/xylan/chitin deacetylase (PgdA/CDA1 family)
MLRLKYRFLLGFALIAAGALYGWTATPAQAATQPGGTPILDNFNRANENPLSGGGNWGAISSVGGAQLVSNAVASPSSTTAASLWRTVFAGDVETYATIPISTNNAGLYAETTLSSGNANGYLWQWQGSDVSPVFRLYRADNSVLTTLGTFSGFTLTAGDKLALRVIGDSVQGWVYHLGDWQQVASATDTTYRTGQIGVRPRGTTPIIDDFGGGPVLAPQQTVVSLTFDDAWSDQSVVPSMLASSGMHGTFYVNSGNVGSSPSFLGWSQLQSFQGAGNEIAGHTINHVDLTTVSLAEAQRQVCQDRRALMSQGLAIADFAYPYGDYNTSTDSILQGCGYNSGRRSWGLCSPAQTGCPAVETIPPQNRWEIRTQASVRSVTTVQDLENAVMNAEATGGWITLVFHHVCDGCDSYAITQSNLQAFLDWLQPRSASGTVVKTVHEVMGGSLQPAPSVADQTPPTSSSACNAATCSSGWYTAPVSVSLSSVDSDTGVAVIRYTTDGSDPTAFSPIYSASFTVGTTTTVKYRAWDNAGNIEATQSQLISIDAATPVSSITCDAGACSSTTYSSAVTVALSATDSGGSALAAIRYTTDGSDPTTSSTLYAGTFSVALTTTVKFRAWDNAGNVEATNSQLIQVDTTPADTTPPTSSISCNSSTCSSGWYAAPVSVSLSAVDSGGSGVAFIRYTTDGSEPSVSSLVYSAPFTVSSTTTVKYRAWDNAGNVETTNTQLIQIDTTAPQVTLTSPVNGATVSGVVRLEATATDVGLGVSRVDFYVDGKIVGTATLVPYRVNWNTNNNRQVTRGSHTIYAIAVDRAGNSRVSTSITVTVV